MKPNEVIRIPGKNQDGTEATKPWWTVRVNGELLDVTFSSKKEAYAYLVSKMAPRGFAI